MSFERTLGVVFLILALVCHIVHQLCDKNVYLKYQDDQKVRK